jgi:sulfoacetaldehyde dehydrogenase
VARIYEYQGAGHSVSLHSKRPERALDLGLHLPVARVIVNQVHVVANGGSFSNSLPVSLSMGCGTWGDNSFTDNMNVRQYMNVTRVVREIPERVPSVDELLKGYFERWGR